MKKKAKSNPQFYYFKGLKILALTAFFCTVTLAFIIFIESLIPGNTSYNQTVFIENNIKSTFQIVETDTTFPVGIYFSVKDNSLHYKGDTLQTEINLPKGTAEKQGFSYTSSDENLATIDEKGLITFVCNIPGTLTVTAASISNPAATATIKITANGIDPALSDNLSVVFPDEIQTGSETTLEFFSGENILCASGLNITSDSDIIRFSNDFKKVYALASGTATITAVAGENIVQKTINVLEQDFILPTQLVSASSYTLTVNEKTDFIVSSHPLNSVPLFTVSSSDATVAMVLGNELIAKGVGNCTLTVTSLFNNSLSISIPVNVNPVLPASLVIIGADTVKKDYSYRFSTYISPNIADDTVVWSIVRGKCVVDENGYVYPTKLGKFTLRATSVADPSVYSDKTVTVALFDSFYMFVRKIIGHFSLFAILGFGLAFTFFTLVKPRWIAPIASVISGFVTAGISEMLQLPAFSTGRYSTWTDVWIDTIGVICGICIATAVIILTCFIWHKVNNEQYRLLKKDFNYLTAKTVFKKEHPQS